MRHKHIVFRHICSAFVFASICMLSGATIQQVVADDTTKELTPREKRLAEEKKKSPIVPVVAIRAGESTELLLSTWCTLGVTRGRGLDVSEMVDGRSQYNPQNRKFVRDGLTVTVPGFAKATQTADKEIYRPLREKGIGVFAVEIAATADAVPGAYEFHVSDSTCSGNCQTNIRVVVVKP